MAPNKTLSTKRKMQITLVLSLALMVVYCGQSVLITASKNEQGDYDYDKNTSVLLSELAKLIISLLLLWREAKSRAAQGDATPLTSPVGVSCLRYAVPAILYAVHNNFIFRGLKYLGPATYQLFNNLKIVTTGVVFRFALGRRLRLVQWFAILLLLFGMVVAKMKMGAGADGADPDASRSGKVQERLWEGFMCMLVVACTSAVAGVYNEYLIKTDKTSLFWKNCQLYFFSTLSCLLAGAWTAMQGDGKTSWLNYQKTLGAEGGGGEGGGFLHGFGLVAWSVVLLNGILGQIISAIFLYASVIVKVYAASGAILVTAFISSIMFGTPLTIPLFIGIGIALISMFLYFLPAGTLDQEDTDVCKAIAAKAAAAGLCCGGGGGGGGSPSLKSKASYAPVPGDDDVEKSRSESRNTEGDNRPAVVAAK